MSNADLPAMPTDFTWVADHETHHEMNSGLTKLEHFAGLAPVMPVWFEAKFLSDTSLNLGIDFTTQHSQGLSTSLEGEEAMFLAWPVYYAKALLKQLEGESNE